MACGISLMASEISFKVLSQPFCLAFMAAIASGDTGNSGTFQIDHTMVDTDNKAPMMKATWVISGI